MLSTNDPLCRTISFSMVQDCFLIWLHTGTSTNVVPTFPKHHAIPYQMVQLSDNVSRAREDATGCTKARCYRCKPISPFPLTRGWGRGDFAAPLLTAPPVPAMMYMRVIGFYLRSILKATLSNIDWGFFGCYSAKVVAIE